MVGADILKHELYLPSLGELNDPADGRPKRAPKSEDELAWFLICGVVEQNPTLPLASLEHEAAVIRYNVRLHGTEVLRGQMSELLNSELEGYRIYSMSKHPDANPFILRTYRACFGAAEGSKLIRRSCSSTRFLAPTEEPKRCQKRKS